MPTSNDIVVKQTLDTRGTLCPVPIIRARQTMDKMSSGEVLKIVASDPGSKADVPGWARMSGHTLLQSDIQNGLFTFWVRKA